MSLTWRRPAQSGGGVEPLPSGEGPHVGVGLLRGEGQRRLGPAQLVQQLVEAADVVLEADVAVYVHGLVQVREEVGEQQWRHLAHQDVAELLRQGELQEINAIKSKIILRQVIT